VRKGRGMSEATIGRVDLSLDLTPRVKAGQSLRTIPPIRNEVTHLLDRLSRPIERVTILESGGYTLLAQPHLCRAPSSCDAYATASRDLNPIHRSGVLAALAGLASGRPVVHGMWTAAMARRVVE
jgi:hypothetical protein